MTTPARSALMKRVGRRDTAPELAVRAYLHAAGLRYRLHVKALPGTPDIVLPRFRTVVFVHGCFWHGHTCKHGAVEAKTNRSFWQMKITDNRARDQRKAAKLADLGWHVETVWECESGDESVLGALVGRLRERAVQRPP